MSAYGKGEEEQLDNKASNTTLSDLFSLLQPIQSTAQDEDDLQSKLSIIYHQDSGQQQVVGHSEPVGDGSITLGFIIISAILSTIVVCTFLGNLFVIVAIFVDKNLQTSANQLVLSLALADLMVACLVMPLGAYNDIHHGWYLGKEICEFWTSADVLCCTASILNLLAIAIDRYKAVTNVDYIYKRTRRRVSLMILCAWTVGAVVSLAPIFGWKDPDFARRVLVEHKCLVSQDVGYQIFATISTFYAPLVLLLALYWRIFQVARKRIRNKPGGKAAASLAPVEPAGGAARGGRQEAEPSVEVSAASAVNNNNNCDQFGAGCGDLRGPVGAACEGRGQVVISRAAANNKNNEHDNRRQKAPRPTSSLQHHQLSSPQQLSSPSRHITAVTSGLGYVANNQAPSGGFISATKGAAEAAPDATGAPTSKLTGIGGRQALLGPREPTTTTIECNLSAVEQDDVDCDGHHDDHRRRQKHKVAAAADWQLENSSSSWNWHRGGDVEGAGTLPRSQWAIGRAAGTTTAASADEKAPNGDLSGARVEPRAAGCFHCSSAGSSTSTATSTSGSASSLFVAAAAEGAEVAPAPPQDDDEESKCHCCCCSDQEEEEEDDDENDEDEPSCSISASQLIKCDRQSGRRQQEPREGRPDYCSQGAILKQWPERDNGLGCLLSEGAQREARRRRRSGAESRRRRFSESPSSSTLAEADVVGRTIGELQLQQHQHQLKQPPASSTGSFASLLADGPQPPAEFQDRPFDCHSRPSSSSVAAGPNHDEDKTTTAAMSGALVATNNILTVNNINVQGSGNLFDCELSIQSSEKGNGPAAELALPVLRPRQPPAAPVLCQHCPSTEAGGHLQPPGAEQTGPTDTTSTTTGAKMTANSGQFCRKQVQSTARANSAKLRRDLRAAFEDKDEHDDEGAPSERSRSLYLRRKFRALGQLVSFVQTSRQFNSTSSSSSSAPTSPSGNDHHHHADHVGPLDAQDKQVASENQVVGPADEPLRPPERRPRSEPEAEQEPSTSVASEPNTTVIDMPRKPKTTTRPITATTTITTTATTSTSTSNSAPATAPDSQPKSASNQQIARRTINRQNMDIKREKKAAKTLAIITGVFVCCWLPFFLNAIVMPICGPACTPSDLVLSVLLWLGYLNSLLNPIIYTIFSPDFRRAFNRLLSCLSWAPATVPKAGRVGNGRRVWPRGDPPAAAARHMQRGPPGRCRAPS